MSSPSSVVSESESQLQRKLTQPVILTQYGYLNCGGKTGDPLDLIFGPGRGGLRFGPGPPGWCIGVGGRLVGPPLRPNSIGMRVLPKKPPGEGVGRPNLSKEQLNNCRVILINCMYSKY